MGDAMTSNELCRELEQRLFEQVSYFVPEYAIQGAASEVAQLAANCRGEELGSLPAFAVDVLAALARAYSKDVGRWPTYRRMFGQRPAPTIVALGHFRRT
jgi:hypothetical protein